MKPIPEADAAHDARHKEINWPCQWTGNESLDEGCYVRYRVHKDFLNLPTGIHLDPLPDYVPPTCPPTN